ncbi:MAG: hypothetical protein H0U53_00500, partial [Actinobacteria bacterium]|nr:hypothetical protein [Actinomycetota bacterium]
VWTIAQQKIILKAAPIPEGNSAVRKPGDGKLPNGKTDSKPVLGRPKDVGKTDADEPNGTKPGARAASKPHPSSKKKKRR